MSKGNPKLRDPEWREASSLIRRPSQFKQKTVDGANVVGFAATDPETARAIHSKGGKTAHERGTARKLTKEDLRRGVSADNPLRWIRFRLLRMILDKLPDEVFATKAAKYYEALQITSLGMKEFADADRHGRSLALLDDLKAAYAESDASQRFFEQSIIPDAPRGKVLWRPNDEQREEEAVPGDVHDE